MTQVVDTYIIVSNLNDNFNLSARSSAVYPQELVSEEREGEGLWLMKDGGLSLRQAGAHIESEYLQANRPGDDGASVVRSASGLWRKPGQLLGVFDAGCDGSVLFGAPGKPLR